MGVADVRRSRREPAARYADLVVLEEFFRKASGLATRPTGHQEHPRPSQQSYEQKIVPTLRTLDIPIQRAIFGRGLSVRVFEIASRQHGACANVVFWTTTCVFWTTICVICA